MKTAGTQLYFLDPDAACAVVEVGCPTSITGIDTTVEQLETTCLSDLARTYEAGLATPGTASFTLSFEPDDPSHQRLLELKQAGTSLQFIIGFPDGTADPVSGGTDSAGDCQFGALPTSRSWLEFGGFVNSYAFDFALGGLITATVGIQVSGEVTVTDKTT